MIHYQTETVAVCGADVTIRIVAVVCDECGGTHVRADAWDFDTEMAVDEAKYSGGWQIEDGGERHAVCGSCSDAGVELADVVGRATVTATDANPS